MDGINIGIGVIFGLIGAGYFWVGKKRGNMRLLFCGLVLGIFPYFVPNPVLALILGVVIAAFPLIFRGG